MSTATAKKEPDDFGTAEVKPTREGALLPIKSLSFKQGTFVALLGNPTASGVSASPPKTQQFFRIHLDLRLRAFKIEQYGAGPKLDRPPTSVKYVPLEWCAWEPLTPS